MKTQYFRRFRMEIDLDQTPVELPPVPPSYRLLAWQADLLNVHAEVKHKAFRNEIDAQVFPCFTELALCRRLMEQIVNRRGFIPEATWLAVYSPGPTQFWTPCGTIQGVRDEMGMGWIQNLGVVPEHRNKGLGRCLLSFALDGFRKLGISRVHLEVTAENYGAVRLYEKIGFQIVRTLYKPAEVLSS